ncbi:MAG: hypothetical protein IPJ65_23760 [Archangiaceae bacterium]|nr:hypothetical protein [Archangiaceae bacterium]
MGRPRPGGSCQGRVGILLGDWALSLPGEQALTPGNGDYDASARQIWSNNGGKQGNAAETLAVDYAGWAPYHLPFVIQNNTDHTYTESISGSGSFLP